MSSETNGLQEADKDSVRQIGALLIAGLALVLSISGIGDSNSGATGARNNVLAADAFAWYQAKNIRQTSYELARDELMTMLEMSQDLAPEDEAQLRDRVTFYEAEITRNEDEPDPSDPGNPLKGEGKIQLLAQARDYGDRRMAAGERGDSFDFATVASGIGIVVASAGILLASRTFLVAAAVLGVLAILFLLNAAFEAVSLDFFVSQCRLGI